MFQLGVQTIAWGERIGNLDAVLQEVAELGFQGVEFAQIPTYLDDIDLPPDENRALSVMAAHVSTLLEKHHLTLLGLAGGPIATRRKFIEGLRTPPLYLYTDSLTDVETCLSPANPPLAVHPHMFTVIEQYGEAVRLLTKYPSLRFLPDTAHLFLAGADVMEVFTRWRERMVAVHIKDWDPRYGWSRATYARGFCELGQGVIPLAAVLRWLREDYSGWVVVEQDFTELTPVESLSVSVSWLKGGDRATTGAKSLGVRVPDAPELLASASGKFAAAVATVIKSAQGHTGRLYAGVAKSSVGFFGASCASVWEVSSRTGMMTMHAFWPPDGPRPSTVVLKMTDALCAKAVADRRPALIHDLQKHARDGTFLDRALVQKCGVNHLLSIPVSNFFNINRVELLINVFLSEADDEMLRDRLIPEYASVVSQTVGAAWLAMRSHTMETLDFFVHGANTTSSLLDGFLPVLKRTLDCGGASVFLVDQVRGCLDLKATTGLEERPGAGPRAIRYLRGEGPPGKAWETRDQIHILDSTVERTQDRRPWERTQDCGSSMLVTPIYRFQHHGEIMGVIRCLGKRSSHPPIDVPFSTSDEINLDALQAALSQPLERLLGADRRIRSLRCISHELRVPIMMVMGAAEKVMKTTSSALGKAARTDQTAKGLLRKADAISRDLLGYARLMDLYVDNLSLLRPDEGIVLERERVILLQDIIAPVVSQIGYLLRRRRFSAEHIEYLGLSRLPAVFIDNRRFLQVFFNLFSNAVKYAYPEPSRFRIQIIGRHNPGFTRIEFRDWGTGIAEAAREDVFEEGFRGENARQCNVTGDGLGLWLVRRILEAHGASVRVTGLANPTELTLTLPSSLEMIPQTES